MAFTHTITTQWSNGSAGGISGSLVITADAEDNRDITVPVNADELPIDIDFVKANVKSLVLSSDRALTIREVADGPAITLAPNIPFVVTGAVGSGTGVFEEAATGVSQLLVSNASATNAATLRIRLLHDSTP